MSDQGYILVVDDLADVREVLATFLKIKGYATQKAENGRKAVELVRAQRPNLVFLDTRMPDMGGLEALDKIKEIDNSLPVIMMSGIDDEPTVQKAQEKGAKGFILKPFDFPAIEVLLKQYIPEVSP